MRKNLIVVPSLALASMAAFGQRKTANPAVQKPLNVVLIISDQMSTRAPTKKGLLTKGAGIDPSRLKTDGMNVALAFAFGEGKPEVKLRYGMAMGGMPNKQWSDAPGNEPPSGYPAK